MEPSASSSTMFLPVRRGTGRSSKNVVTSTLTTSPNTTGCGSAGRYSARASMSSAMRASTSSSVTRTSSVSISTGSTDDSESSGISTADSWKAKSSPASGYAVARTRGVSAGSMPSAASASPAARPTTKSRLTSR